MIHGSDVDLFQRPLDLVEQTPYELRLSDIAVAAHELGETGQDEKEIDYESLAAALGG